MKNPRTIEEMPEFMSSADLVELGLFKSTGVVHIARKTNGAGPPFIKLRHKVLYAKQAVIDWLEERTMGKNSE